VPGAITQVIPATYRHTLPALAKGAAFDYIQALLSCGTENGWQMAEQVGYASPYRLQHLLGRAIWDEEQMCAEVRDYVVAHLMMEQESWP